MAVQNVNNLSYTLSLNILKALGGDTSANYESVDDIWGAINDIYDATGDRVDIEALIMTYTENGSFQYYPTETADAYAPVLIDVAVPQKYTDEQVAELQQQSYDEGIDAQKALLKVIEFTENGTYTREDGWSEVTVNTPKGVPQEDVDRLVEEAHTIGINTGQLMQKELLESTQFTDNGTYTREDGWNSVTVNVDKGISTEELNEQIEISYNAGYAQGYTSGSDDGYQDGYAEGLDDGAEDQKALLESTTITENGTYTKEDGWNEVVVAVEGSGEIGQLTDLYLSYDQPEVFEEIQAGIDDWEGIAGFNRVIVSVSVPTEGYTQEDLDIAASEGYQNGYNDGHDEGWTAGFVDGEESVRSGFQSIEITENGTYIEDGGGAWNEITVNVAGGGGSGKPKIYNGFRLLKDNLIGPLASKLSEYDFSQYDWSNVYDMSYFFAGFQASNQSYWGPDAFNNFVEHFNGRLVSGKYMFQVATGYSTYAPLHTVPNLGTHITRDLLSTSYMFYEAKNLYNAKNLANWDTSKVVDMSYMFYNCPKLSLLDTFDTSNVRDMNHMFMDCSQNLTTIPQLDTSNVVDMSYMFNYCENLETLPPLDCSSAVNFDRAFNDCYKLKTVGGFPNLGKARNLTLPANTFDKLTEIDRASALNILNGLYDRASAGYPIIKLPLASYVLGLLTDEDKAIATNKGWSL